MSQHKIRKIYLNKSQEKINLIKPWSYYGILGRGSGKSTRILALRGIDATFQMPGSSLCFFGNSYMNLVSNLVPKVISGWKEFGYVEGWDFVVGTQPPPHFKPLISPAPGNWKHTITWANGTVHHLGSMDRISNILSHSFQHFFGDEARIIDYEKVSQQAFPTMRGERIRFANASMYAGFSFTSDMPDPETGQWLLEKASVMDPTQIELILRLALEENNILLQLTDPANADRFTALRSDLDYFRKELAVLRENSLYYDEGSSLVNVDALGINYIKTMKSTLSHVGFLSSILNILTPDVETMFYFALNSKNILEPNFNYDLIDKFDLKGQFVQDSRSDKLTDPNREIYGSLDFGNMNGIVLRQMFPNEDRSIKCLYVLQPEIIDDLADKFCEYYRYHHNKVLHISYDRAGNNRMPNSRLTVIEQFVARIHEKKQSWKVYTSKTNLRNVYHSDRRQLINRMLGGIIPGAPSITFDSANCKELLSSLKIAKIKPGSEDEKDKRNEKTRRLHMLPMYSTNFSDAFDYGIWDKYGHLLKNYSASSIGMPSVG